MLDYESAPESIIIKDKEDLKNKEWFAKHK